MTRRREPITAVALTVLVLLAGCGSSKPASVEEQFLRGVEQIRGSTSAQKLHEQLVRTVAGLRRQRGATAAARRTRLAVEGFASTLVGLDAQLDLIENDSGNIEAAIRDARKADRYRTKGANLLRAAGRAFGIEVGRLRGY